MQNRQRQFSHNERRYDAKNEDSHNSKDERREDRNEPQNNKAKNELFKAQSCTYSSSHFLGFIYNLALLYLVYYLINNGEKAFALIIFSVNALIVILAILTKVNDRRKRNYNNHRRNRNRKFRYNNSSNQ